jgi:hypothetical protein
MDIYQTTRQDQETTVSMAVRLFGAMGATAAGSSDMERLFGPGGSESLRHTTIAPRDGYTTDATAMALRRALSDGNAEVSQWQHAGQRTIIYATSGDSAAAVWGKQPRDINRDHFNGGIYGEVIPNPWRGESGARLTPSEIQSEWDRDREEMAWRKESARLTVLDMLESGDSRVRLSASGKTAILMDGGQEVGRVCISTPITPDTAGGIRVDYHTVEAWGTASITA